MRPIVKLALSGVVTLALSGTAAGFWFWVVGGERHVDGEGPLASLGNSGNSITHAFDPSRGPAWTIGIQLCLYQGAGPAVLDGPVSATTSVGSGLRFLGARARQMLPDSTPDQLYGGGAIEGFPPTLSPPVQEAKGFVVTAQCHFNGPPDPPATVAELDVGLGAPPSSEGGGWEGFDIGYTSGGFHHILSTAWNVYICGTAISASSCPDPMPHAQN